MSCERNGEKVRHFVSDVEAAHTWPAALERVYLQSYGIDPDGKVVRVRDPFKGGYWFEGQAFDHDPEHHDIGGEG